MLSSPEMELFLNLVWLLLSTALVACWVARSPRLARTWVAVTSLCLLILLLLPVISMTDDVMTMSAPAETEHLLRAQDPWSLAVAVSSAVGAWAFAVLLLGLLPLLGASLRSHLSACGTQKLLAGMVRCCAVRPPPALARA